MTRTRQERTFTTIFLFACAACSNDPQPDVTADAGSDVLRANDSGIAAATTRVTVNVASPHAISPMFYAHNYYNWIAAWGGQVLSVKDMVLPLGLNLLRAGGTPSDVSTPVMFDFDQLDTFVHYAADVGAKPLLQIPFVSVRDADGQLIPATSQNAANIVRYANVDHGYGIRYFTIGNEPDIYEQQGQTIGGQSTVGYTPEQFCAEFSEYVAAMKAVDPTIRIVTVASLHGFASTWTWVGSTSTATACATPTCSAPGSLQIGAVPNEGAAPLTPQPVSCAPAFAPSALCTAGAVTKDPTYQSAAALGFNLQQTPPGDVGTGAGIDAGLSAAPLGTVTIPTSIAVTVKKFGAGSGNSALRVQLTDSNDHFFCALEGSWSSGQPIPITHFNSKCWDNSGTYATPTMSFKRIDVLVPSSAAVDRPFSFCLTAVTLQSP
jgi:hypothetical protein